MQYSGWHPKVTQITHAIILTDSMDLLLKVESGMDYPGWHTAMQSSAAKTTVDLTPSRSSNVPAMPVSDEMNRQMNWQAQKHHIWSAPLVDSFKRRLDKHWAALPSMYDPECLA